MSTKLLNRILSTTLSRIKFSRPNIVSSSSFKRLTLQSANQLSYQPIISKCSISTSLIRNAEVQKKCLDLSEELKTYDIEQILNLMKEDKKHDWDPTHLAICMKRLHALYMELDCELRYNIFEDPRFEKFSDQLLRSAPNMSPSDIVFMVKFSQNIWCRDSHRYTVLKLCTNVIGDLTSQDIADLTETMTSIIVYLEDNRLCDYLDECDEFKSYLEWILKLINQIEMMMKCLLLLAESKDHQFRILNVKSRVDLLLAFGINLNSVNSLLSLMLEDFNDFLEHPEELVRAISALLICLSSYPNLSPPPISSTPQMFPSFMNLKFSRFMDVLLSNNDDMKDRLLKDIRVDDEYDKFCEGFEKTLLRTNKHISMESQKAEKERRIILLTQLLNKTLEAFHRIERPFKIKNDNWDMLLTACTEFLRLNPTNVSDHLISQCLDLISTASNEKLKSNIIFNNFDKLAMVRYYPGKMINDVLDDHAGPHHYRHACLPWDYPDYHLDVDEVFHSYFDGYSMDENIAVLECFLVRKIIYDSHNFDIIGCDFFFDELENAKHLSKHDLDFKMKFISYMLSNKRKIPSIDPMLDELQSNLEQYDSDESKINNALMFLTCVENSTEYSSYLPLINELKNKFRPNNEFVDKMINKLWPGRVKRSPSAFNGYVIDFPTSDNNDENSKKVHLTFHYDDSYWRNTGQLRPLWHLAEKTLQCQGYHVVLINVSELLQMPDAEEYLKYSVDHSEEFQDIICIDDKEEDYDVDYDDIDNIDDDDIRDDGDDNDDYHHNDNGDADDSYENNHLQK